MDMQDLIREILWRRMAEDFGADVSSLDKDRDIAEQMKESFKQAMQIKIIESLFL